MRPSNIDAAKHSRAILKLLVERFRQVWPQVKVLFRADSGFCRWKLLRWCDRHGVDYIVGIAKNSRLLELAEPLMSQAQHQFEASGQNQRLFAEAEYAAKTWDRQRRTDGSAAPGASDRHAVAGSANADDPAETVEDRRPRGHQHAKDRAVHLASGYLLRELLRNLVNRRSPASLNLSG